MDYAWQRLSAAEAGAVDTHLVACAECRAVLAEERAIGHAFASVPVPAPRIDVWDAVRARRLALEMAASIAAPHPIALSTRRPMWRGVSLALSTGIAALALMLSPSQPVADMGDRELAQTIDQARQVVRQSDNPLGDVTNETWTVLAQNGKEASL